MPPIGYTFILGVCFYATLVAFGKVKPWTYPLLLYGMGVGMVLMTSMAGPYLVGSDIHLEYYYARLYSGENVLPPIIDALQGTSIVNNFISPLLGKVIPLLWVYKLVYPLLFAFVPVILYFIFRKWVTPIQALLASFFFMAFPTFSLEIPTIARQMVAEVILAALLYLLIIKPKILPIIACGILLPLLHYSIALVAPALIGPWFLLKRRLVVGVALAAVIISSAIYFPLASNGVVAIKVGYIYNSLAPESLRFSTPKITIIDTSGPIGATMQPNPEPPRPKSAPFWERYDALMRSGLGVDFFKTTPLGKIFRTLQWIMALLMIWGLWKLRKVKGYWIIAGGSVLLLPLLFLPGVSSVLNTTRILHLSLFLLAPTLAVTLRPRYLLFILVPYFLFTSGLIFEVTKQPNAEEIIIPYSYGLSNYRLDLGATTTKDDIKVRDYIYKNELYPVYADINGANLIGETVGWRDDLHKELRKDPPTEGYVFVRTRNLRDGTFTIWSGVGLRKFVKPEVFSIDWNEGIIYQSGDSRVLKVK